MQEKDYSDDKKMAEWKGKVFADHHLFGGGLASVKIANTIKKVQVMLFENVLVLAPHTDDGELG